MNEPLIRFLTAATVILAVGLGAASVLRRRSGPAAATTIQRVTLAAVAAAALLAPLPGRIAAPLILLGGHEPIAPPGVSKVPPPISDPVIPVTPRVLGMPAPSVSVPLQAPDIVHVAMSAAPWVWAIGVFLGLLYLGVGLRALRRLHHLSLPVTDPTLIAVVARVAVASGVRPPLLRHIPGGGPFLAGGVRPTLYLPGGAMAATEDVFVAALFHEMAHVQRQDLRWGLFARLVAVGLWWHPLAWGLRQQMEQTAEEACDDAPVWHGAVSVRAYADLLLRLADEPRPALALAAGVAPFRAEVGRRIRRLLTGPPARSVSRAARVGVVLGGIALTLVAVSIVGRDASAGVPRQPAPGFMDQMRQSPRQTSASADPGDDRRIVTLYVKDMPVRDVLASVFRHAGARFDVAGGVPLDAPVTVSVNAQPLVFAVNFVGRTCSPQFECIALAGGSYRVQPLPACTLTGRVVWPDGTPAKGVRVTASLTDANLSNPRALRQVRGQADTDDRGAFTITDLGPYPYRIQAVDSEHAWVATEFPVVTARSSGTVRVPKLTLTRVGVIQGTVTDFEGQPRQGVHVSCDSPFYGTNGAGAVTDAPETDEAGHFRLLVVPGTRTVTLPDSKGDTIVAQTVDVEAGEVKPISFGGLQRDPGAAREAVAAFGRTVSLTAKDMPVRDAITALLRAAGIRQYEIAPEIGGTVTIDLNNVPFRNAFNELGDKAKPRFRGQMDNYVYYARPLPPTGTVAGKVVYPDGKPAAGIYVMAQMNDQDSISGGADASVDAALVWGGFGRTAADGTFQLIDLGRYRYNISVSLFDPHLPADRALEAEEHAEWIATAQEVTPEPGKETTMPPLRLIHGAVIEGTLTDASGKPLSNVHIGNHGPHRPETSAGVLMVKTDARGHFQFRVAPGRNLIYIAQDGFSPAETQVKVSDGGKVEGMGNSQTSAYITVAEGETKKVWFKRVR